MNAPSEKGGNSTSEEDNGQQNEVREEDNQTNLSNKALWYHELLRRAHEDFHANRIDACRQRVLELLEYPYLGDYTRLEALHLLGGVTISFIRAQAYTQEALDLINELWTQPGHPTAMLQGYKEDNAWLMKQHLDRQAKDADKVAAELVADKQIENATAGAQLAAEEEANRAAAAALTPRDRRHLQRKASKDSGYSSSMRDTPEKKKTNKNNDLRRTASGNAQQVFDSRDSGDKDDEMLLDTAVKDDPMLLDTVKEVDEDEDDEMLL